MTSLQAQIDEFEIDPQDLLLLEQKISEDLTIMEDIKRKFNEELYVAKVTFAEIISTCFKKLARRYHLDDEVFKKVNFFTAEKIHADDKFAPSATQTLIGFSSSGLFAPVSVLGTHQEFFGMDAVVDTKAHSEDRLLIRFRPLFAHKCQYIEWTYIDNLADAPRHVVLTQEEIETVLRNVLPDGVLEQYKETIKAAHDRYQRERDRVSMTEKYGVESVNVW